MNRIWNLIQHARNFIQRRDREIALLFVVMWLATTALLWKGEGATERNTSRLGVQQRGLAAEVAKQKVTERVALASQVNACRRLNIQRALVNREGYANFRLWNFILDLIVHPIAKQPVETPAQQKLRVRFLVDNRRILKSLQWVPLTDCNRSVTAAGFPTYGPRNFSPRHAPPRSALYPTDGAR